jgi:hypothetical protein
MSYGASFIANCQLQIDWRVAKITEKRFGAKHNKSTPEESGVGAIETKTNDYSALGRKLFIHDLNTIKVMQQFAVEVDFGNVSI